MDNVGCSCCVAGQRPVNRSMAVEGTFIEDENLLVIASLNPVPHSGENIVDRPCPLHHNTRMAILLKPLANRSIEQLETAGGGACSPQLAHTRGLGTQTYLVGNADTIAVIGPARTMPAIRPR
jgi:hypothetical protein